MSPRKRVRKNYYRNSPASRRAKRGRHLAAAGCTAAGLLLTALLSMGLLFSYDFLTQCDYFDCDVLQVEGNRFLSDTAVLQHAGVFQGRNSLSVNLSLARKHLLNHPWIAEASVSRTLPNRIDIVVVEHAPIAILDLERRFLINQDGIIFKEKSAGDPEQLPVVKGLSFSDIIVGDQGGTRAYRAVLKVLRLGRSADSVLPNDAIQTISVDRDFGLTVTAFDQPKSIHVGWPEYPEKYAKLKVVLHYLAADARLPAFHRIDLNPTGRIVLTPVPLNGSSKEV